MRFLAGLYELDALGLLLRRQAAHRAGWKPRGTTTMCHLRALLLGESGQWENYWSNASLT